MTSLTSDGPMDAPLFRSRVGQYLVLELKPGDILVIANRSGHKDAGIRPDEVPKKRPRNGAEGTVAKLREF